MGKKELGIKKDKSFRNLLIAIFMILLVGIVIAVTPSTPSVLSPVNNSKIFNYSVNLMCSGSAHPDSKPINTTFYKIKDTKDESGFGKLLGGGGSSLSVNPTKFGNHLNGGTNAGDVVKTTINVTFNSNIWVIEMSLRPRNNLGNFSLYIDDVYDNPIGDLVFNFNDNLDGGDNTYYKTNLTLNVTPYNNGVKHNVTFQIDTLNNGNGPEWDFWWNETNLTKYGNQAYGIVLQNSSSTSYTWSNPYGLIWSCQSYDKDMNESAATSNRTLIKMNITGCSASQSELNLTFINESNLQSINGRITSLSVDLSSDDSTNYIFTNLTGPSMASVAYCMIPDDFSVGESSTVTYTGTSFVTRTSTFSDELTGGKQINRTLYLLPLLDGQYVTFQVVDFGGSPINNVSVSASKVIGGNSVVVGNGYTDNSGSITFWLDPSSTHTISASKSGVGSTSQSITPSQTSYTITLGTSASSTNTTNLFEGIEYSILPSAIVLDNDTLYNFTLQINSSYWNFTSYGFGLYNSTGLITSTQDNQAGGSTITIEFNTTGQSQIDMKYWWNINGNITNQTKSWTVRPLLSGSLSIKNFFTDFTNYANVGFNAGFNDFGRVLISIIILVVVVSAVTFGFGIYSPAAISAIAFLVVFGLESTGLMPPLIRKYLLTAFVGFITVAFIIQEQSR